ncbi:MAG: PEP-CTERM sorting domain-containing protein [Acidobacteria bacterium]|nr:PEP-CTERM sorting domain-containing protein [Acidobacteriota bacterium]
MILSKKQMTLLLLGALSLFFIGMVSASAAPVTFTANTSGKFGAGSTGGSVSNDGSILSIGGTTVAFNSKPSELFVNLNPGESSNVTLGVFAATSTSLTSVNGATFTLNITFTLPSDVSPNPATYNATLTGTISAGASGASVVWTTNTLSFTSATGGAFTLTLEASTPINAPTSPDASRIRGTITSAPIPEPITLLTLGSGLAGLAALAKRRKKA